MNHDLEKKLVDLFTHFFEPTEDIRNISMDNCKQWTSLNHIRLIIKLEKAFNIKLPAAKIIETTSFSKLLKLVKAHCK
jgi:acyl carrier protein